jgi:hypothetical protein
MIFRKKKRCGSNATEDNALSTLESLGKVVSSSDADFAAGATGFLIREAAKGVRDVRNQVGNLLETRQELARRQLERQAEGPVDLTHLVSLESCPKVDVEAGLERLSTQLKEGPTVEERLLAMEREHEESDVELSKATPPSLPSKDAQVELSQSLVLEVLEKQETK